MIVAKSEDWPGGMDVRVRPPAAVRKDGTVGRVGPTYDDAMAKTEAATGDVGGGVSAARTPPGSFEEAMSELEQILTELERGDTRLEQSLAKYERGTFLIQYCRKVLTDAEHQVEVLTRGPDGSLKTEPLDGK